MPRLCTWGGRTAIAALLVLVYRVLEYISLSLPTKLQCFGVGICDCFYFLAAKVCLVGTWSCRRRFPTHPLMVYTPAAKCLRLGAVGTWPPSLRLGLWGGR